MLLSLARTVRPDHLNTVLSVYALVWAGGAVWAFFRSPGLNRLLVILNLVGSVAAIALTAWFSSVAFSGKNPVFLLVKNVASANPFHLAAAGLGATLGFGAALWPWQTRRAESLRLLPLAAFVSIAASFFFLALFAMPTELKVRWAHRSLATVAKNPSGKNVADGFVMSDYYEFVDKSPVQLAIGPNGMPYVCYLDQLGGVARLEKHPQTGTITAKEVAWNLNRVQGLVFDGSDLYVSRSGRYTKAEHGPIKDTNTGAVTLLRDMDNDGVMDYYHDVVTGLPGSQSPDPIHQNNGIVIGPDKSLYITVASNANRAPAVSLIEGSISRVRLDGSNMTVFAKGMRNPFDCAVGPDNQLFCTDNDIGYGKADELNHVVEGGHYGHPYVGGDAQHKGGSTGPVLLYSNSTLQGLTYATSPKLSEKYRNRLYVVSFGSGEIHRVTLHRSGASYRTERELFATVPGALDIAVDTDGIFYVACYGTKKIVRIAPSNEP